MADVSVRPAGPADVAEIARIQVTTWQHGYADIVPPVVLESVTEANATAAWTEAVTNPPTPRHHVLVAQEQQWVVGFVALAPADDLQPDDPEPDSTVAIGPLLGSLPAQFHLHALRLPFVAYLLVLAVVGVALVRAPETVERRAGRFADLSLRPRFGVPREQLAAFVSPAVTAFVTFALIGFYAALIPSLLADALKDPRPLVAGAVLFLLFAVAAAAVQATRAVASRTAMLASLALFLPAAVLLVLAEHFHRLSLLLAASALAGAAASLGYRGSLAVVNRIAPEQRRAEVVSTYLIVMFCGNSLPVIGIGLLSSHTSPAFAHEVFAGLIIVLAAIGLAVGWKYAPRD